MNRPLSDFESFPFAYLRTTSNSLLDAYNFPEKYPNIFLTGVYLSSPELSRELGIYKESRKKNDKVKLSLNKYWIRNCSRSTPFATFGGGCTVDITDGPTHLIIDDNENHLMRLRLDMNYLCSIIQCITNLPEVLERIRLYPNNSLYSIPNGYRYVEYTNHSQGREYNLISVEHTTYLEKIFKQASNGSLLHELQKSLATEEGVSEEEAKLYITDLINSQLLTTELEPNLTGGDALKNFIERLSNINVAESLVSQLSTIQGHLSATKFDSSTLLMIESLLDKLNLPIPETKMKFQTDLFISKERMTLNREVTDKIMSQIKDLSVLSRRFKSAALEEFKSKFKSRFDMAECPLAFALDSDLGIGYVGGNPDSAGSNELIDDIPGESTNKDSSIVIDQIQGLVSEKYIDYIKNSRDAIEISEEDLARITLNDNNIGLSNSFFVKGSLFKNKEDSENNAHQFMLEFWGGPSAANMLGRFAYGDSELSQMVKEIVTNEELENPDCIYAEVVHLPQERLGNVILRPVFRKYEIPYIGVSGAASDNQLSLEDLFISVDNNNNIILRSKKLNKIVIPRMTNAHNYHMQTLPIYRFLCDLQTENIAQTFIWEWGAYQSHSFLPRVSYKDIILFRAQWYVNRKELEGIPDDIEEQVEFITKFRKDRKIPSRVLFVQADNELLLDLTKREGIQLLLHYLKRESQVKLKEQLVNENNCIVHDIHGKPYVGEFIFPYYRPSKAKELRTNDSKEIITDNVQRNFSPFSEWLYFKITCGPKTTENILKNGIHRFIQEKNSLFEKFFFIRYKEEFPQLRIRFFNANKENQLALFKSFSNALQPLVDSKFIDKIVIDTYSRELERYGVRLIEESELLFYNDSLCIINFIKLLSGIEGEKYRFLFALRGIDMLLDDFSRSLVQKKEILSNLQSSHLSIFGGSQVLRQFLNDKYRKHQRDIFSHMDPLNDEINEIVDAVDIFRRRSAMNKPIIENMKIKIGFTQFDETVSKLLPSYIHMYMNRLFIANQRKYELVIYHFLERYYISRVAKESKDLHNIIKINKSEKELSSL